MTAIEPQGRHPERRSIFLDGEFALGVHVEVVARSGLRVGQQLTLDELRDLARTEEKLEAHTAALDLLGYRDRSRKELERGLLRRGFDAEVVDEVLVCLTERGLVDDGRFSREWVAARTGGVPRGPARLAAELRQRGVGGEQIEVALEAIDPEREAQLALAAGRKKIGSLAAQERPAARRKLAAALRRRGFSWDAIRSVCDHLLPEGDEC